MIHLYMGDGKGKTTAAVGLAVRAAGRDYKVLFSQFMKGNETGEILPLREMKNVLIYRSERNFGFYSSMSEEDKSEITQAHNQIIRNLMQEIKDTNDRDLLIVMDEITYPVKWKLVDPELLDQFFHFVQEKSPKRNDEKNSKMVDGRNIELVLTGRDPEQSLLNLADYITEMRCVQHPFITQGVPARKGIEY